MFWKNFRKNNNKDPKYAIVGQVRTFSQANTNSYWPIEKYIYIDPNKGDFEENDRDQERRKVETKTSCPDNKENNKKKIKQIQTITKKMFHVQIINNMIFKIFQIIPVEQKKIIKPKKK